MVTNTQEASETASERVKVQSGGRAKPVAPAREVTTFEKAPPAEAELRLEEAKLRLEEVRLSIEKGRLRLEEARLYLTMQSRVVHWLMTMATLTGVAALAAVFLNGFGLTKIPESVVITLLTLPVAKIAAMFLTVVRHLFSGRSPGRLGK